MSILGAQVWKRGWFLLLSLAVFPYSMAVDNPILINFDAANPPFMYGSMQHAEGLYPELVAATFRQMEVPVLLSAKPWKRAIGELELGLAGIGGIYKTEERLKKYDYSDTLFVERIAVYYHRDGPVTYASLSDLHGKRIGVLLGWSYGDEFDQARSSGKMTVEEVPSDAQNFDKLAKGRLDVVLAIEQVGTNLLRNNRNIDIQKSPVYLVEKSTHLALHKKMEGTMLLTDFNRSLHEIRKSGAYGRILKRFGLADR